MTVTMTVAAPLPLLPAVLWVASVAAGARSACLLAALAFSRGEKPLLRLLGWQGAAYALTSAASVTAGAWQYGVPLAVMAAVCAAVWLLYRGKRQAAGECGKGAA